MKKKTLIVEDKDRKIEIKKKFYIKLMITVVILILSIILIANTIARYAVNDKFAESISEIAKMNSKTVFSIDRIYLYSGADAKSKETTKPIWDLDVYQYTDIALYINNRDEEGVTYENTIKDIKIDNVKFNNLQSGEANLYYKNVNNFAKFNDEENSGNEINDDFEFKIVNSGDNLDYAEPIIYSNCQNPITLEYVNKNMKKDTIISDIGESLIYDGSLLKRAGILLSKIECMLSFKVTITNNYNQEFVATVYIDIPLEDKASDTTIYDGKVIKEIKNTNLVKFVRVK